ncbi:hypothetical protein HK101_004142 [Irineochytrium annulatum]|nr:hypothetical protein HK101_004142 [Irineochytrium annulatum]
MADVRKLLRLSRAGRKESAPVKDTRPSAMKKAQLLAPMSRHEDQGGPSKKRQKHAQAVDDAADGPNGKLPTGFFDVEPSAAVDHAETEELAVTTTPAKSSKSALVKPPTPIAPNATNPSSLPGNFFDQDNSAEATEARLEREMELFAAEIGGDLAAAEEAEQVDEEVAEEDREEMEKAEQLTLLERVKGLREKRESVVNGPRVPRKAKVEKFEVEEDGSSDDEDLWRKKK